jgi:hypothetical protein
LDRSNNGHESDQYVASLSLDERMNVFEELLRRGEMFYPKHEAAEGYPRVHRVVDLRGS